LFLSPEAPYPAIGGGALRSASLLEYLARRYTVDAILFRQPHEKIPVCSWADRLLIVELPEHRKDAFAKVARNLGRLLRGVPPLIDRFSGFGDQIAKFVSGQDYAVSVIEHFWCAAYHEQIAPRSGTTVLDLHNIESDWHNRCALNEPGPVGVILRRFGARALAMEQNLLPRFSMLLATSETDAGRLRAIAPAANPCVYPNTIPLVPEPAHPDDNAIVFAGNLEYLPNVQAVRYFHQKVWPLVRKRNPGLRLRLIGRNSHGVSRYIEGDPSVDVTGPVFDAVSEMGKCKVGVVPVQSGSGTRLKILEMWAAGIPVVSTTLGAEGLCAVPDRHLLIADGAADFAESIDRLLRSDEERRSLGSSGRRFYEENYTWEAGWSRLDKLRI
jgi:glycosyltransferase involved in cell wall biosynthesis